MSPIRVLAALLACIVIPASPAHAQTGPFPGDYDADGVITLADFASLHSCLDGPNIGPPSPQCEPGDLDVDDDVDLRDIRRFLDQFGMRKCDDTPFNVKFLPISLPTNVVVTDLNNDAIQDIVTSNRGRELQVSFGQGGHGDFAPFEIYASAESAWLYPAAEDFDNDGNIDLALSGFPDPSLVTVLFGDGAGGLADTPAFTGSCGTESRAQRVEAGDFDGNGWADILVDTEDGLACLLNNGDRTFRAPICEIDSGTALPATGDFNRDGLDDVVASVAGGVRVFLSNGDGSFETSDDHPFGAAWHIPAIGDMDADGDLDLVVANFSQDTVSVLLGIGDGSFEHCIDYPAVHPRRAKFAYLNSDSFLDLVVSTMRGIHVFTGNGDGTLEDITLFGRTFNNTSYPQAFAIGRFDADASADVVVVSDSPTGLGLVFGRGDGRFEAPMNYPVAGASGTDFVHGDFDNDGDEDLALLGGQYIAILANTGLGVMSEVARYNIQSTGPGRLSLADLDHDGDLDLLVVPHYSTRLRVLQGKEGPFFDDPALYEAGSYATSIVAADYNLDTHIDVVLTDDYGLVFLPGLGDSTFGAPITMETTGTADDLVAVDFDHDGIVDLAVLNAAEQTIDVLLGLGNGDFAQTAAETTVSDPKSLTIGDIDGNDIEDLIVASTQELGIHLATDYGFFAPVDIHPVRTNGTRPAVADVNGDSRQDLVCIDYYWNEGVDILFGAGGGLFEPLVRTRFYDLETGRFAVQTVDMTNDHLPDVVVMNENSITVAENFCGP